MPWSEYLMSNAQILIALNWFAEGNIKKKFTKVVKRKSIIVFTLIFFVHIVGLLYTSDYNYALRDIRIKLPLLSLPVLIGTSPLLKRKEFHIIIKFFIASVLTAGLFSFAIYKGYTKYTYTDYRSLSVFISHIRFSLMIVMSFVLSVYLTFNTNMFLNKIIFALSAFFSVVLLFFLHSYTGIFIFFALFTSFLPIYIFVKTKNKIYRMATILLIFLAVLFTAISIKNGVQKFYTHDKAPDKNKLDKFTLQKNKYHHSIAPNFENGHFVGLYLCEKELEREWNKISKIPYDSLDKKGNNIKYTLIRYLTSKNLRKDSVGVSKLNKSDISLIENGTPNYIYKNKFSIYPIIYKILWQYENYKLSHNANKNSLMQRYEFFKTGIYIAKQHLTFGVGTGDVQISFDKAYDELNSKLDKEHRLRAHNQYLTFIISFGVVGFLIILFALFYPLFYEKHLAKYILVAFLITNFLSWFNEDTLETQAGVTFFIFFYVLFVFAYKIKTEDETTLG